jgi:hypothetical protein
MTDTSTCSTAVWRSPGFVASGSRDHVQRRGEEGDADQKRDNDGCDPRPVGRRAERSVHVPDALTGALSACCPPVGFVAP